MGLADDVNVNGNTNPSLSSAMQRVHFAVRLLLDIISAIIQVTTETATQSKHKLTLSNVECADESSRSSARNPEVIRTVCS